MAEHDAELARAFDAQAPRFERAPVQSDPQALLRLVREASFPPDSRILDAGCGPGLVSRALLESGVNVHGVDLSMEMVERARLRCADFAGRFEFHQLSVFDPILDGCSPFDGSISRYVLHHVLDPLAFLGRQVKLLRPGGTLVLCDHITDPDSTRAAHHGDLERSRDKTHTANLTAGQLVDLFARLDLAEIRMCEESFVLDFDEWFDRGTPVRSKAAVRESLLDGPRCRGFLPTLQHDGRVRIEGIRVIVRGIKK